MARSSPPPAPLELPILGLDRPRPSPPKPTPPAVAGAGVPPAMLSHSPSEIVLPQMAVLNFSLTLPVADEEFYRITFVGTKLLPLLSRYHFIPQSSDTVTYTAPSFKCHIREISSMEISVLSTSHATILQRAGFAHLPSKWLIERNPYEVSYLERGIFLRPYTPSALYVASSEPAERVVSAHRDVSKLIELVLEALRDELVLAKAVSTETDEVVSRSCCIIF